MHPIEFKGHNVKLIGNGCNDLPVFTNGLQCVSCWQLSDDEIEKIKETKQLWLSVHTGATQPPVLLSAEPLIKTNGKK